MAWVPAGRGFPVESVPAQAWAVALLMVVLIVERGGLAVALAVQRARVWEESWELLVGELARVRERELELELVLVAPRGEALEKQAQELDGRPEDSGERSVAEGLLVGAERTPQGRAAEPTLQDRRPVAASPDR